MPDLLFLFPPNSGALHIVSVQKLFLKSYLYNVFKAEILSTSFLLMLEIYTYKDVESKQCKRANDISGFYGSINNVFKTFFLKNGYLALKLSQ